MSRHAKRIRYVALLAMLWLPAVSYSAEAKKKLAIPDEADLKESLALIKEIYESDYDKARTPQQKSDLAKKLLEKGIQSKGDPAGRFALFKVARDMAAQSGDVRTALLAVEETAKFYDIDDLKTRTEVLAKAAKARGRKEQRQDIATSALDIIGDAIVADRYDLAAKLGSIADGAARRSGVKDLIKRAVARKKQIEQIRKAYVEAKQAQATLEDTPTDPNANLTVGMFLCFYKGNWARGVSYLALGSNATFKELAKRELKGPMTADEQSQVGDGWWRVADGQKGLAKTRARQRAAHWYRQASLKLSGLAKDRVEKRLEAIASDVAGDGSPYQAVLKDTLLFLTFDRSSVVRDRDRTIVKDRSGHGHHGIVRGATFGKGEELGTVKFRGANQTVEVPGRWDLGTEFTLVAWVKFDHFQNDFPSIMVGENKGVVFHGLGPEYGNKQGGIGYYSGKSTGPFSTQQRLKTKRWYFVVATDAGSTNKIYVDGQLAAESKQASAVPPPVMSYLRIGAGPTTAAINTLNGAIGEILIIKRVLKDSEIKRLYYATRRRYVK